MQTQPNCNEGIFQLQTCEWSYHAIRLLSKNSIFTEVQHHNKVRGHVIVAVARDTLQML